MIVNSTLVLPKGFGRVNESRRAVQSLGDFGYECQACGPTLVSDMKSLLVQQKAGFGDVLLKESIEKGPNNTVCKGGKTKRRKMHDSFFCVRCFCPIRISLLL